MQGFVRTYTPKDDDGVQLPPEIKRVQYSANAAMQDMVYALRDLFNIVASKDWANTKAKSNVEVDGNVLLQDVPVTFLLFLEKQMDDLYTFIKELPVLG